MAARKLSTLDEELEVSGPGKPRAGLLLPEPDEHAGSMAIQYCLGDFGQCPIYKRTMGFPES